jgi:ribonuclease P protein component
VRSPFAAMKYCHGKKDSYRLAVVVSKKAARSAPMRNRIRRRVYGVIAEHEKYLDNLDVVVTIFDDRFFNMPHKELETSIIRQLQLMAKNNRQNKGFYSVNSHIS